MMIGEGATGRVFIGSCRETSKEVAVKIIHEKVCYLFSELFWIFWLLCMFVFVTCLWSLTAKSRLFFYFLSTLLKVSPTSSASFFF